MKKFASVVAFLATSFASSAVWAACTTDVAKDDLTDEQVQGIYDCIKEKLREGYAAEGVEIAKEYQGWKAASTLPAVNGSHGKRFLMTFVNETGFAEYTKFSDERGPMPVGSILAKESFNVNKKGEVKQGPLFFMVKAEAGGDAKEYGDWVYSAYSTKGKAMKIKQAFCHGCHSAFEDQDAMGYPGEDYRVSAN